MYKQQRSYCGKILVFGEYSVIEGSHVALMPYRRVHAELVMPHNGKPANEALESNGILRKFADFIGKSTELSGKIDKERLNRDIGSGLYLESNILPGRGLGSSGALCAAVYGSYAIDGIPSPAELRRILSEMESYFHGTSSGVDPLCIFLDEPVAICNGAYILPGNEGLFLQNQLKMFFIDTGRESTTSSLVKQFRKLMKQEEFGNSFRDQYIPLVNLSVDQWLESRLDEETIFSLSIAQQKYFNAMIPADFREIWNRGIESGLYALKLCGSGGGGYLLGFTRHLEETAEFINNLKPRIYLNNSSSRISINIAL